MFVAVIKFVALIVSVALIMSAALVLFVLSLDVLLVLSTFGCCASLCDGAARKEH